MLPSGIPIETTLVPNKIFLQLLLILDLSSRLVLLSPEEKSGRSREGDGAPNAATRATDWGCDVPLFLFVLLGLFLLHRDGTTSGVEKVLFGAHATDETQDGSDSFPGACKRTGVRACVRVFFEAMRFLTFFFYGGF